jgi:hypothetical protein
MVCEPIVIWHTTVTPLLYHTRSPASIKCSGGVGRRLQQPPRMPPAPHREKPARKPRGAPTAETRQRIAASKRAASIAASRDRSLGGGSGVGGYFRQAPSAADASTQRVCRLVEPYYVMTRRYGCRACQATARDMRRRASEACREAARGPRRLW